MSRWRLGDDGATTAAPLLLSCGFRASLALPLIRADSLPFFRGAGLEILAFAADRFCFDLAIVDGRRARNVTRASGTRDYGPMRP